MAPLQWELPKEELIRTNLASDIVPAQEIVEDIVKKKGPVDIYSWFEGTECVPRKGAAWMKENIFEPLFAKKKDCFLHLYSLKGSWNFEKTIKLMPSSTRAGAAINGLGNPAVSCMYGFDFFRFCQSVPKSSGLYGYVDRELPKKTWLFDLSKDKIRPCKTVSQLFDGASSLFDCIQEKNCTAAYSAMQYLEGYYLVRESVRKGLSNRQERIQIAFVLPNDEGKYYREFSKEIAKMLRSEFGDALEGIGVDISFYYFQYGKLEDRPYIGKTRPKVTPDQLRFYLPDAIAPPLPAKRHSLPPTIAPPLPSRRFFRDEIHNLND
jgi:hypothetical protein